jgi:hypothetical protein
MKATIKLLLNSPVFNKIIALILLLLDISYLLNRERSSRFYDFKGGFIKIITNWYKFQYIEW